MRQMLFLVFAACVAVAASAAEAGQYRGDGTYIGLPSGAVVSLFAQFPSGGQGLADAIAELLTNDSELGDDVAFVAVQSGNPDQISATGAGMAQAERALRNANKGEAASRIARAARESCNPRLIAMAGTDADVRGGGGFAGGLFLPSNNASTSNSSQNCVTTLGNTMVSPAAPPMTICH